MDNPPAAPVPPPADAARRPIRILPDALVNKIAAGEVVERPASVVKELLENAVDAGAAQIVVTIENGGKTLIRVRDDGCGMTPEETPLAFARHATSKIQTVEDLFAIATMGFRGEALASVAGVSHAVLITRAVGAAQAVRLAASESRIEPAAPCAAPPGTTVEVRDLFYCVPARRKFLRGDATEFGHIQEMVCRIALAHPAIALTLKHNDRTTLQWPATDRPRRIVQAFGEEFQDRLLPVDLAEPHIQVQGYIGLPETARATARYQYLFLNGRYIRDRALAHALKEAYRGLIDPQAQPVAVLFITLPPAAFDVNVHPQKTEVRFREPNLPYRAVLSAVRAQLLSRDLTPRVRGLDAPPLAASSAAAMVDQTRQIITDFFRRPEPPQPPLDFGGRAAEPAAAVMKGPDTWPRQPADTGRPQSANAGAWGAPDAATGVAGPAESFTAPLPSAGPGATPLAAAGAPGPRVGESVYPTNLPHSALVPPARGRYMQVHNSYLVSEESEGLLIADQHALHERIIYEQLLEQVRRGRLEAQRLLLPVVVPITPRQAALLEKLRETLLRIGIEISEFDTGSIAVQSLPTLLRRLNPLEYLRALFDQLLETSGRLSDEALLHEVLDLAACKAAVKAGDPLAPAEIESLLARRGVVQRSSACPHGRPTTIRLTWADLERQFKRR